MAKNLKKPAKPSKHEKLSSVVKKFLDKLEKPRITIGELTETFSGPSYGVLIFLLALPNLIPAPTPGISAIVGIPLVLLAAQLVIGKKTPWLPKFLFNKKLKRNDLRRVYDRAERYLKYIEKVMKPRLQFLIRPPADRLVALLCLGLSALIMLPIPFSNVFPAFAVCLLALAMLMRDGLFVMLGTGAAIFSAFLIIAIVNGTITGVGALFDISF